ncbi:hypothetical protein EPUL_004966 [Erysiphe pulchra]|uniref:Uncharacterized protein n=1 Tax=Erysiphe pulchra TaxID=225359 RepID=A0A2S4PUA1_9PEZI|nr:hypothetical protein EPUL_004966 [Erysiphe pulchra]
MGISTYWHDKALERCKRLEIGMTVKLPPELRFMSQRNLELLLAARSRHVCSCERDRSSVHPFPCRKLW